MLPRSLKQKGKVDKPTATQAAIADAFADLHPTEVSSAPLSKPAAAPVEKVDAPANGAAVVDEGRQADIVFAAEVIMSDWGLWLRPELLKRLTTGDDGCALTVDELSADSSLDVHFANLLSHDWLNSFETTQPELAAALQTSELLELSEDGLKIRRKSPVDSSALEATTADDWGSWTFYLENLPLSNATPAQIRSWLGELLSTTVQTVRLPPLYSSSTDVNSRAPAENLYDSPSLDKEERAKRRGYRLPPAGGSFKGFAFVVLGDSAAAAKARTEWAYGRATQPATTEDAQSDDEEPVASTSKASLAQEARRRGLRMMPITEWNALKGSYLSYKRALTALDFERQRDRERDAYWDNARSRHRDDDRPAREDRSRASKVDRWDHIERSPSPPRLELKPDCTVFVSHLHSGTNRHALTAVFKSILDAANCTAPIAYVDYERGLDACHVRFDTPDGATVIRDYFSSGDYEHDDPRAETAAAAFSPVIGEDPPCKAEVITGEREQIYFDRIRRKRRTDDRDDRPRKRTR